MRCTVTMVQHVASVVVMPSGKKRVSSRPSLSCREMKGFCTSARHPEKADMVSTMHVTFSGMACMRMVMEWWPFFPDSSFWSPEWTNTPSNAFLWL